MPPMHCDHVDIMYNHDEQFAHLRPNCVCRGPGCRCQAQEQIERCTGSCSDKLLTLITISEAVDSGWSLRALLSDSVSRFHWH